MRRCVLETHEGNLIILAAVFFTPNMTLKLKYIVIKFM